MSGSGGGFRRLMRYADATRDGRPVYVGTLCNATGDRRLMRYAGEYPGFWTGGASGSGSYVDPRPVYVSGECTAGGTQFSPPVPPPYIPGTTALDCCAGGYGPDGIAWPALIAASLTRTFPAAAGNGCVNLDGLVVPMWLGRFVPPGEAATRTGWFGTWRLSPALYPAPGVPPAPPPPRSSAGTLYLWFWCTFAVLPGPVVKTYWHATGTVVRDDGYPAGFLDISPSVPASGYCTDAPEFACGDPIDVTFGGGPFPDPAKPCGLLLHQNTAVTDQWGTCYSAGTSEGYTARFTGPAPYWLPGSGGGGGSGSGSGTGPDFFHNRTLMRYAGYRAGRAVYLGTCCPSGAGCGTADLTATFSADCPTPTGVCAELDGAVAGLAFDGTTHWSGGPTGPSHVITVNLECVPGQDPVVTVTDEATGETLAQTSMDVSYGPLQIVSTMTYSECPDCPITVTIVE